MSVETWLNDKERGALMSIERINEEIERLEHLQEKRSEVYLLQKKKQEMIWRGQQKEKEDKFQEKLDATF